MWDLSTLFGLLGILYFSFIFFFRNKLSVKSRNRRDRRKELAPIISNFLFYGADATKEEKHEYVGQKIEIRKFVEDSLNRRILNDILLDLQRDLTGEARERLFSLYKDYDLHLDAISRLKSWRWEVVTRGIVELTQMQVVEAYSSIRKFINHRRSVIRRHAQIATVSLKHEGISHFLDSSRYPISEWQQIKILEVLQNKEDFIPPNFGTWLTSAYKDVVLFSLRLIRYYNQTEAKASVIQLLRHKDDEIKQAAIDCIKEFGIAEAIPTLMASFSRAKRDTQILILGAIGQLGSEKHIPFLRKVYEKTSDFNVRAKALGAINTIVPETVLPKENLDTRINPLSFPEAAWEDNEEDNIPKDEEIPQEQEESPKEPVVEIMAEPLAEELEANDVTERNQTEEVAEEEIVFTEEGSYLFEEDLDVFDHCFMEELNEILDMWGKEEEENVAFLPLDFLPIIKQNPTEMDKKNPKKKWKKRLRKIRVSYEVVHPDAEFREELENILSRVEVQNPDGNTEVEYLNFNFLPFVVENDPKEARIPALLDEINQWEVDGVEIVLPEAEQVSSTTGKPAQEHEDNGEVSFDACAFVNWEELSEVPAGHRLEADSEVIPQSDETYAPGQSIFEDLFRKCDEDSKLILLSEMLNLGDQKELAFLGSLNGETSPKIRKKIEFVSSKLRKRLQKETPDAEKTDALIRWATIDDQSDTVNFDLDNIEKRHS